MQGLPNVGDILDDTYRIEALIGQGGFGAVYLARQMSMDRQVAIKVLVAHAMNVEEMIERFRREVMAVRNLSHPNTIRIYDFRDRADGMLYYVMEYIKGATLKDLIKEAPIPVKRVKHVLRQVVKSLSEAHSYGIVHRDLKPANIMLADLHGETDFVKVVDFGIAKIVNNQESDDDADPLTSAGVLVGTLRYMAPEQITGQGIGPQSDLYAMGLIAIEMLTGKSVFEGTGRWEVLHKQISDDPVEIPAELHNTAIHPFLLKALEKRLDKRFKTADEMLKALDAVDDGTDAAAPVAAAPAPAPVAAAPVAPVVAKPDPAEATASIRMAELDEDATQMAPLPSEEMIGAAVQQRTRPVMQTNPVLSPVPAPADEDELPAAGANKLMLGAIGVTVLVLVGIIGFVVTQGNKGEDTPVIPAPDSVAVAPTAQQEKPVEPVEKPVEQPVEKPVEVAEKFVRFDTPGIKAEIYNGTELIGITPMRVKLGTSDRWLLKAAGYEDQSVTTTADSPEDMTIALVKVPVAEVKPVEKPVEKPAETTKTTTTTTTTKPKDKEKPADDGWVDVTKPKDKPKTDKATDSSSDWVDVKKADKPKVPVFE